jgi:hypothetical protein
MKILKWLLGLIALVLVGGLLMPGLSHVERSMTINATTNTIFAQVTELKNWKNWSPWYSRDPNMAMVYSQPSSAGTGAYYTWDSANKEVGKGKMTILDEKPNENVHIKLEFDGMGVSTCDFKLIATDSTTTMVKWSMDSDHGLNPLSRIMGTMMDKFVGPDFEKGLANLKAMTEVKH